MARFTTINVKFHEAEQNWSVTVDGEHYQTCPTLSDARAVVDARPFPVDYIGGVEATTITVDCSENPDLIPAAKVVFRNAR